MTKPKVVNLYGGPGTGKSTIAAGLFSALKMKGVNCEYIQEYAKDKAWEFASMMSESVSTPKVFKAQEYVFGKQHFRMRRCSDDVTVMVADSPIMLGIIYTPESFDLPSLKNVIHEAYQIYDNYDIFLTRKKKYNPKGRFQTEDEAKKLDSVILGMLNTYSIKYHEIEAGEEAVSNIMTPEFIEWVNS